MRQTLKFKVNLGPPTGLAPADPPSPSKPRPNPSRYRSRSGCAECKRRRVKCDETFPVCLRCQRRGAFCESTPRLRKWQVESPSIFRPTKTPRGDGPCGALLSKADGMLLRYWLEKASQIMVMDPDINPMSFPILEYVETCPSLVHAMQSVSAAHKDFFNPLKLSKPLEERNLAISLLRQELTAPTKDIFPVFTTILLLGLSSDWIEGPESKFGQQHLCGARALVDTILSDPALRQEQPSVFNFVLGAYLYWDMSCAFLIPSHQQVPIDTPDLLLAVLDVGMQYHPIGGYCTEIFYLLGQVMRYCRLFVDTGARNEELEGELRHLMLQWKPRCDNTEQEVMCEAFRSHGMINLALCGAEQVRIEQTDAPFEVEPFNTLGLFEDLNLDLNFPDVLPFSEDFHDHPTDIREDGISHGELGLSADDQYVVMRELGLFTDPLSAKGRDSSPCNAEQASPREVDESPAEGDYTWAEPNASTSDPRDSIRKRAIEVVRSLMAIPSSHACINLQPIPLLTAASELTAEDRDERDGAIMRYRELYSLNRVRANLTCIRLLEHLWELRDAGEEVTWLELMLRTGWYVMLG